MRIALPIAYFQTILLNVVWWVESAQGDKIISAHRQEPDERSMATQTSPWGSMGSEGGLKHWVRRWLPYNCRSFFGVSASSCLISVRLILDHFWLWLIVNDKLVAARSFFIPTLSVLASLGSTLIAIGVWCMICQYVQSNFARTSCQSIFLASHCHCSVSFCLPGSAVWEDSQPPKYPILYQIQDWMMLFLSVPISNLHWRTGEAPEVSEASVARNRCRKVGLLDAETVWRPFQSCSWCFGVAALVGAYRIINNPKGGG